MSNGETYRPFPQQGRERLILSAPVGRIGTGVPNPEPEMFERLKDGCYGRFGAKALSILKRKIHHGDTEDTEKKRRSAFLHVSVVKYFIGLRPA